MNNLDYIMLGGLILLAAVVVIRIWLWRRQSTEDLSQFAVKKPQTADSGAPGTAEKRSSSYVPPAVAAAEKAAAADEAVAAPAQPKAAAPEITDPMILIKTFSAPTEKRLVAIRWAG